MTLWAESQAKIAATKETFVAQIDRIVHEQQNPSLAWAAHLKMKHRLPGWQLPETTARGIIRLFQEQGKLADGLHPMLEYVKTYPLEQSVDVRIVLAQYLIRDDERPRQGLEVLKPLTEVALSQQQQDVVVQLRELAQERKQDVELEAPLDAW